MWTYWRNALTWTGIRLSWTRLLVRAKGNWPAVTLALFVCGVIFVDLSWLWLSFVFSLYELNFWLGLFVTICTVLSVLSYMYSKSKE